MGLRICGLFVCLTCGFVFGWFGCVWVWVWVYRWFVWLVELFCCFYWVCIVVSVDLFFDCGLVVGGVCLFFICFVFWLVLFVCGVWIAVLFVCVCLTVFGCLFMIE